jgi:tight adherence protein C
VVRLSPTLALATACGLLLGAGLWVMLSGLPRFRSRSLVLRLAPHLGDVSDEADRLGQAARSDPASVFGGVGAPLAAAFTRLTSATIGTRAQTARRLDRAGGIVTPEQFTGQLLVASVLGLIAGGAIGLALLSRGAGALVPGVLAVVGAALGFAVRDRLLSRQGSRRVARIESELPTILEFLSLSVSAGESLPDALRRVSQVGSGELPRELSRVCLDIDTGISLTRALVAWADRLEMAPVTRCVGQLVTSHERGTPLAAVLRAQAQDSRDEARRRLIESAGKKEVAMLVPLVFLILPITIAFAIFPGIVLLRTGF